MSLRIRNADGEIIDIPAEENATLAQQIWLSGRVRPPALCSGLGRCGRCRVRFLSPAPQCTPEEGAVLSPAEAAQGVRLACRHPARAEGEIRLFPAPEPRRRVLSETRQPLLLAVDLGTTGLQWRALTPAGECAAEGWDLNPQMGGGSEIMSRLALAASPRGKARAAELVRAHLRGVIRSLPGPVNEICLAANPAMTALFLEQDTEGLAHAPYRLDYPGGRTETLPDLPPVFIPPQIAPFVGGDLSAGALFIRERERPEYPFLLVDLGTNGEFVLALNEDAGLCAGVPLGPALEGIGLRCGMPAEEGAISAFCLEPGGLRASVIGGAAPRGVCATGWLSLLRILLRGGLLSPEGIFQRSAPASPLGRKLAALVYEEGGEVRLALPGGLFLCGQDVEAVLAVKAAFSLTLERLLARAGLRSGDMRRIFIAGALGEHARAEDLETLGFFPPGAGARFTALGNSALEGAQLLLLRPELRTRLTAWARGCAALDLAADPDFHPEYVKHMRFG